MADVSVGTIVLSSCVFIGLTCGLFLLVLVQATKLPPRE